MDSGRRGSTPQIAEVLGDAPAALLDVDLDRGELVHADEVARTLFPGLSAPAAADDWLERVQMGAPDGTELVGADHPLRALVGGRPVPPQAVRVRDQSDGGDRSDEASRLRWMVVLPVSEVPGLTGRVIVMLFSLRGAPPTPAAALADGSADGRTAPPAVLAAGLAYTVADATATDVPLVWVSPGFTATTGYELDEVIGRNCRFLQGPQTDGGPVGRMRAAISQGTPVVETLLNYTKDGLAFWNQVTLSPLRDRQGQVTHIVGVQHDVTARSAVERARDAALEIARRAVLRDDEVRARMDPHAPVAETFSTSTGGLQLAVRVSPGRHTTAPGADWYDVHELNREAVSFAVGEVLGADARSTTAAAQVRSVIGALVGQGDTSPGVVLEHTALVVGSAAREAVGVQLVQLTRAGGRWALRSSGSARPPLLLRRPDGSTQLLTGGPGQGREPALGRPHEAAAELVHDVPDGSTVLACTAGLLTAGGRTLDDGLDLLRRTVAHGPRGAIALCDHVCDALLADEPEEAPDDALLLVLRLAGSPARVLEGLEQQVGRSTEEPDHGHEGADSVSSPEPGGPATRRTGLGRLVLGRRRR